MKSIPLLLALSSVAVFSHAESLSDAIQQCSHEKNSLKRLICYDGISKQIKRYEDGPLPTVSAQPLVTRTPSAPPAPQAKAAPAAPAANPAASSPQDNFGMEYKDHQDTGPDKIEVILSSKSQGPHGKWILTFSNGQVWKQTDSKNMFFSDGQAYVEKGLFGSFFFGFDDTNTRIRVKRIK